MENLTINDLNLIIAPLINELSLLKKELQELNHTFLVNTIEACEILGCDYRTFIKFTKKHEMKKYKIFKTIKYSKNEIFRILKDT